MPKQKIKKSIARRFKVTKRGKVLRGRQYGRHLKIHKRKSRLRRLKRKGVLTGRFARNIKKMLSL